MLARVALAAARRTRASGRRAARTRTGGRSRVRAHSARGAGGADARRSFHPAAVLARRSRSAAARVLDPAPARTPIRTARGAPRDSRGSMRRGAARRGVRRRAARPPGWRSRRLPRRAGMSAGDAAARGERLARDGQRAVRRARTVQRAASLRRSRRGCSTAVAEHHRAQPDVGRAAARRSARAAVRPGLAGAVRRVLPRLAARGKLAGRDRLALPGAACR